MRHKVSGNRLNRKSAHRKATIRDIAKATLLRQRICTTKAKAKEARKLVDKLITLGKKGSLADKRYAFSILCDHKLVSQLFSKMASRFKERAGGYTRIIPLGTRRGDSAQLVYLELTEKEEVVVSKTKSTAVAKKEKVKSVSSAKAKKVTAEEKTETPESPTSAEEQTPEPLKEVPKETVKEQSHKKDEVKEDAQKGISPKDKKSSGKKFMGGIRKIFNKKSSGK